MNLELSDEEASPRSLATATTSDDIEVKAHGSAPTALDRRERREVWTYRFVLLSVVVSIVGVLIASLSWLYPREPSPSKIDPNLVYQNGLAIAHIASYVVAPGAPYLHIDVDQARKILSNDVIDVSGKRCIIMKLTETGLDIDKLTYSYHIYCRLV
jgi:hypothetical protein